MQRSLKSQALKQNQNHKTKFGKKKVEKARNRYIANKKKKVTTHSALGLGFYRRANGNAILRKS